MSFFDDIKAMAESGSRISEAIGGPFGDPFNETATVVSVSDPKNLGRVKVQFQDGITSDWTYVLGSQTGQISAQFIGSTCLVGKSSGRTENSFVLGFFNKTELVGINGQPIQLPVVDAQSEPSKIAGMSEPGDLGLKCNKANRGRMYVIDDEVSQDVVVCLRRNNLQEGTEEVWNWKSLNSAKWIEKGYDPGVKAFPFVSDYSDRAGIPTCTQALEGDVHEFAEDRKFRSFPIVCRRDENGDFGWIPASSPPVVFRTTLPSCTEKVHGMEAILDPGDNSQKVVCLRYQGQMKWVTTGKREPIQFYNQAPPISREKFLKSKKPMEPLAKTMPELGALGIGGESLGRDLLSMVSSKIPVLSTDITPSADSLLMAAGDMVVSNNLTDLQKSQLMQFVSGQTLPDLASLGSSAAVVATGALNNQLDKAFMKVGSNSISQAISFQPPPVQAIYTAFLSSGIGGAMDTLALSGLNQFPALTNTIMSGALGKLNLTSAPSALADLATSALNGGFQSQLTSLSSLAASLPLAPDAISNVSSLLTSGTFGQVSQALNAFSSLPQIPSLLGDFSSLPALASSVSGLVGLGGNFTSLFSGGGLGLSAVSTLLGGANPVASILGWIVPSLGLLGGSECPCGPKCRKIEHGKDSDGNSLLEPCGNVVANSHSSYAPKGDPISNNLNQVAKLLSLLPTGIGEDLCVPNLLDLSQIISLIQRVGDLASRMDDAKHADFPEFMSELTYSFEAIEKALKSADNNITGLEDIERKLIDSAFRLNTKFLSTNASYVPRLMDNVRENAQAIRDLQVRVGVLDLVKNGPIKGFKKPTKSIAVAIKNIATIPLLKKASQAESNLVIAKSLRPADRKWRSLEPAFGLLDIASVVLGAFSGELPFGFNKCKTKRNKNQVLKNSIESKSNSPVPASNVVTVLEATLPEFANDALAEDLVSSGSTDTGTGAGAGASAGTTDSPRFNVEPLESSNILPTVLPRRIVPILDQIDFESGTDSNC